MTSALKPAQLRAALNVKLSESGLNGVDIKKMQLQLLSREDASALAVPPFAGFRIPYFTPSNKPTKFFRVRYLEDTREGLDKATDKKPLRYVQPPNTGVEVYLPPNVPWDKALANPDLQLIITEGELKAYTSCKHGLPAWGLGGVWSFKSNARGELHLPVFEQLPLKHRKVYVIFDSDAISNAQVLKAELALCKTLLGLNAIPFIVRLPKLEEERKTGLDDYLVSEGEDKLMALMEEAEPFSAAAKLYELNMEVAYVRNPGLILRLDNNQRMVPANFSQHAYSTWSFASTRILKDGTQVVEEELAAPAWLKWPGRYEVECITYAPGLPRYLQNEGEINVWPGWGCESKKGSVKPWTQLLDHLFKDEAPEARRWFEQWCAWPVAHPGAKLFSAAVIWSTETGVGKSLVGYTLMKIYGKNATEIDDQQLQGTFNEWAENKQFVMGDDVTSGENKKHMADRLKGMITRKELRLNPKYVPSYTVPDCINYYFNSNHPDAFFIEDKDRRYFVLHSAEERLAREFYDAYVKWMEGDGPSALFHHLQQLDFTGFDPAAPAFVTESKKEMIADARGDLATWVRALLDEPEIILGSMPGDLWTPSELLALYDPSNTRKLSPASMGRELKRASAVKPCRGVVVTTKYGSARLVAVRNPAKWKRASNHQVTVHYNNSRGDPSAIKPTKF